MTSKRRPEVAVAVRAATWLAADVTGGGDEPVFGGQDDRGGELFGAAPAERAALVGAAECSWRQGDVGWIRWKAQRVDGGLRDALQARDAVGHGGDPQRFGGSGGFSEQVPPRPSRSACHRGVDTESREVLQPVTGIAAMR